MSPGTCASAVEGTSATPCKCRYMERMTEAESEHVSISSDRAGSQAVCIHTEHTTVNKRFCSLGPMNLTSHGVRHCSSAYIIYRHGGSSQAVASPQQMHQMCLKRQAYGKAEWDKVSE